MPFALGVVEMQRPASMAPPVKHRRHGRQLRLRLPGRQGTAKRLRIRMLGRFEVELDGVVVDAWRSKRARQLFAYLALNRRDDLSRHRLMGVFWPEHREERAENNLSLTVMALRSCSTTSRAANATMVPLPRPCLRHRSLRALARHRGLRGGAIARAIAYEALDDPRRRRTALDEAIGLYAGDLLPADAYEDWTVELRQHLQDVHTDALQRRAHLARNAGDHDTSIDAQPAPASKRPRLRGRAPPAHARLPRDRPALTGRGQMAPAAKPSMRHLGVEPEPATQVVFAKVTG